MTPHSSHRWPTVAERKAGMEIQAVSVFFSDEYQFKIGSDGSGLRVLHDDPGGEITIYVPGLAIWYQFTRTEIQAIRILYFQGHVHWIDAVNCGPHRE